MMKCGSAPFYGGSAGKEETEPAPEDTGKPGTVFHRRGGNIMAQVRVPKAAEEMLPFCRPFASRLPNACFATYADLMTLLKGAMA